MSDDKAAEATPVADPPASEEAPAEPAPATSPQAATATVSHSSEDLELNYRPSS